jgi:nucleoid-associated protein YgaU
VGGTALPASATTSRRPKVRAPVVAPAPTPTATRPAPRIEIVVVDPGDSLWSITATALGDDADVAEVAAAWPRWWAANRDVIGPDPNLIHPGQRLRRPAEHLEGARP